MTTALLIPLLLTGVSPLLAFVYAWRPPSPRRMAWSLVLFPTTAFAALIWLAAQIPNGKALSAQLQWIPSLGLSLSLYYDGLSALFALLVTGMTKHIAVDRSGRVKRIEDARREKLLAGIANSTGLFLIVVIQYATFAGTGTVYWTEGWLYVNLLFGVVPMMFVLPYFNRYFFRMTGRIYLGALTTCLVFIMILLTNTVCYLPL